MESRRLGTGGRNSVESESIFGPVKETEDNVDTDKEVEGMKEEAAEEETAEEVLLVEAFFTSLEANFFFGFSIDTC